MATLRTGWFAIICVTGPLIAAAAQGANWGSRQVAPGAAPPGVPGSPAPAPAPAAEGPVAAPPPTPVAAPSPAAPENKAPAEGGPAMASRPLFSGTHLGAYAEFAEIPGLLLGLNHNELVLAGGFTFVYDGNGIRDPATNMVTKNHFSSALTLAAAYVFYNRAPVAFGPELGFISSLTPGDIFDQKVITAGMAFYFAPFPAPLVLVAVLTSRTTLVAHRDPRFELITPSLLIGYAIH
jgi:hypothetical protein